MSWYSCNSCVNVTVTSALPHRCISAMASTGWCMPRHGPSPYPPLHVLLNSQPDLECRIQCELRLCPPPCGLVLLWWPWLEDRHGRVELCDGSWRSPGTTQLQLDPPWPGMLHVLRHGALPWSSVTHLRRDGAADPQGHVARTCGLKGPGDANRCEWPKDLGQAMEELRLAQR